MLHPKRTAHASLPAFLWIWVALTASESAPAQPARPIESATKPELHAVTGAPSIAPAQRTRPIGILDFYGLPRLDADRLRGALTFHEGDTITMGDGSFFSDSERRLTALPGVLRARPEVVCCDKGRLIVYIGIE